MCLKYTMEYEPVVKREFCHNKFNLTTSIYYVRKDCFDCSKVKKN